jgi:L-alanine-DL-glutamate epimerase-like enolase superfamily enzyme
MSIMADERQPPPLKITNITSELFEWPRPGLWNGSHYYGNASLHKVTVYTDQGLVGAGWNGGTAASRPQRLMPAFVDYYRDLCLGRNPLDTAALVKDLWEKQIKILGPAGLHTQVLAAILIACWDIKGKAFNQSVHQLLGGAQQRVPVYIAGGYYAEGKGLPQLQDELRYNVEELHARAVKMKIGDPKVGVAGDLARVAAAREAIGPDIKLMVDANCACDLLTAIEFAHELPHYDVYWFEEPMPIYWFEDHRKLAAATPVKIAVGENYYTYADFKNILDCQGAAILNVDVAICPGYDVARDVALLAQDRSLTIAPHGCPELQLPLVAGLPNGEFLEYYPVEVDPLRSEIFQPQLAPDKDGYVTVPDRPGIGYELNMELLGCYRVM